MYCVQCGVKLSDTEKNCPLCKTVVYHPDIKQTEKQPLYPANKMPKNHSGSKALNGAVIILFLIPIIICFISDLQINRSLDWSGYVIGALTVSYITFALPMWFRKPNPVIFVPCDFVTIAFYLLYIDLFTSGGWYLNFALPVVGGIALIVCTVVTLIYYLRKGRLYIIGGAFIALGGFTLLMEYLMDITFGLEFIFWSVYPLISLVMLGGLLIYLGINKSARDEIERKLFF